MCPRALTVGMFDGVHVGHRALLQYMQSLASHTTVITFSNHPLEVLLRQQISILTPPSLKVDLLKKQGIDEVILLPFTSCLAEMSYEAFLTSYVFDHLVLGEGSSLGKDGLGTADVLTELGKRCGFSVHSFPKQHRNGQIVSSTRIRSLISEGNLAQAEALLERSLLTNFQ